MKTTKKGLDADKAKPNLNKLEPPTETKKVEEKKGTSILTRTRESRSR